MENGLGLFIYCVVPPSSEWHPCKSLPALSFTEHADTQISGGICICDLYQARRVQEGHQTTCRKTDKVSFTSPLVILAWELQTNNFCTEGLILGPKAIIKE
jgi:hypothetical protein